MAHKPTAKTIIGAKLKGGETIVSVQGIQFQSQEQADQFAIAIEAANNGSTEPIILPDGTELRPLTNGERWFLEQLMKVNLFFLLFSGMR